MSGKRGRRGLNARTLAGQIAILVVVGFAWQAAAGMGFAPPAFIGEPLVFVPMMFQHIADGTFVTAAGVTLEATVLAFVIGSLAALASAFIIVAFPIVRSLLEPYLTALNTLPRVALIPLFIIWFGLGLASKVASGISLMYFILLFNTLAGAASVESDHLRLCQSLGMSSWRVFTDVTVPTAVPAMFAGLRLGLVYTLLGVVTAELIAGGHGLGSLVSYYSNTFDANGVFAVLLILVLVASAMSGAMTRLERHLTSWRAQ